MLLDLTIPLDSKTPIYPGDPQVIIDQGAFLDKDQFVMHKLALGTHTGTHIDAPMHMLKGGKTLDEMPLETFFGKGVCIDVSANYSIDTLEKYTIEKNDIVLLYTGWEEKRNTSEYFEKFPPISVAVCNYLIEKGVKLIGTDSPSADDIPFTSHKLLLQNNILIIEALINIKQLIGKKFTITALPLRLALDGSPIRVIADVL
ncbi:MAG TPA: cyclase family protein [Patescibacteria group bacterium]